MSEKTNQLLHLFSKVLRRPELMVSVRMEERAERFKKGGERTGARGLLMKLWEQDGLTNSEISELLDIRPSSVTAQVKELEQRGYVERKADENDGRLSRIFLTEEGRALKDKRSEQKEVISEGLFSALSEEEQGQLASLLEKLKQHWSENPAFDWMEMSRTDWKAMGPEERRAMKEGVKADMRRMKSTMRDELKGGRSFPKDFDFDGKKGLGRPNGDFFGWITGAKGPEDYPEWRERHFGPRPDDKPKKKGDEKGWEDF